MIPRITDEQVAFVEDAETAVKLLVRRLYFDGDPIAVIRKRVYNYINSIQMRFSSALRNSAKKSLYDLAERTIAELRRYFVPDGGIGGLIYLAIQGKLTATRGVNSGAVGIKALGNPIVIDNRPIDKAVPPKIYSKRYMLQVSRAMDKIAELKAVDPNDMVRRNSLRNLAEMDVRNQYHIKELQDLRENGDNLVICSVHADCSDRCFPWQGRVYSLNGTYGKTADGKKYVPLEVATDQFYTTKAGKVYKNGLLGFNCRHRLYPYRAGMKIPKVTRRTQQREYAITEMQRKYEVAIVKARSKYMFGVDPKQRKIARERATRLYKSYVAFSLKNKRAYYPDRTRLLYTSKEEEQWLTEFSAR